MLKDWIASGVNKLQQEGFLPENTDTSNIIIETTKDETHGDYATNFALTIAKFAKSNPRAVADKLIASLDENKFINKLEIAGPGFINIFLSPDAYFEIIKDIHSHKADYGKSDLGQNKKIHIEFVSANPTGPLHVGHGRHAAFGACVANLLDHAGFDVHREYYVNDAGRQMQILGLSLWYRYLELNDIAVTFPAKAYQGEYVKDIAEKLNQQEQTRFCTDEIVLELKKELSNLDIQDDADNGDLYVDACINIARKILGELNFKVV